MKETFPEASKKINDFPGKNSPRLNADGVQKWNDDLAVHYLRNTRGVKGMMVFPFRKR